MPNPVGPPPIEPVDDAPLSDVDEESVDLVGQQEDEEMASVFDAETEDEADPALSQNGHFLMSICCKQYRGLFV